MGGARRQVEISKNQPLSTGSYSQVEGDSLTDKYVDQKLIEEGVPRVATWYRGY